ncbi:MAG: glycosyltransferase N-terminal domain-containing protein [Candidatus Eisenbacteria bacterium]
MNLTLACYRLLTWVTWLLGAPAWLVRMIAHSKEMRERLAIDLPRSRGPLWLHAASLGELEAVRNLLLEAPPEWRSRVLGTGTAVSARAQASDRLGGDIEVRFAPLDFDVAVSRFLRAVRPRALLLVETELWPVMLDSCRRAGVPAAVISGRLSDRSWRRLGAFRRSLGAALPQKLPVAAQGEVDADRFRALGVGPVTIRGNAKYRVESMPIAWGEPRQPFVVALGSLRRGEESILLELARGSSARRCLLLLAPRHLRELPHWQAVVARTGVAARLRSSERVLDQTPDPRAALRDLHDVGVRLILIDRHGELRRWYAAADCAVVGGTFVPIGGHSLFEPASLGLPVLFGPHVANVRDVASTLVRAGGGIRLDNASALVDAVVGWIDDPAARDRAAHAARSTAEDLGGACGRIWAQLAAPGWPLESRGDTA